MKIKLVLIAITAIMFVVPSYAQKKVFSNEFSYGATSGRQNGQVFSSTDFRLAPGVMLSDNFALRVPAEFSTARFGKDDNTIFRETGTLGLEAGYSFMSKLDSHMEITATGGSTYTCVSQLKYAYCDCGPKYAFGVRGESIRMFTGIGMRYYLPYNSSANFVTFRATIGFMLN